MLVQIVRESSVRVVRVTGRVRVDVLEEAGGDLSDLQTLADAAVTGPMPAGRVVRIERTLVVSAGAEVLVSHSSSDSAIESIETSTRHGSNPSRRMASSGIFSVRFRRRQPSASQLETFVRRVERDVYGASYVPAKKAR
jgi:hypothetical protein